jgi:hypothetical protein
MSASKHTPGPWVLQDGCSWRRIGTAGPLGHDGNVLRPFVARDGHPDLVVSQADAALICAAPSLLSALQELVNCVDAPDSNCSCHISPPCSDCVNYGGVRAALKDAAAAIAAAEGQV